jgi:CheY-like chemotaxis protein
MMDKKRLLAVSDLNIAGKINQMNDGQLQAYMGALNAFIDNFPAQEKKLTTALEAKDYESFSDCMAAVYVGLKKIHADALAQECFEQMDVFKALKHETLEAWTVYFLGNLNALSIDIQMAEYKEEKEDETPGADEPAEDRAGQGKTENQKTILAVDDAAFFLSMLKKHLSGTRHKLICVNSGEAALQYLMTHDPDLFILDIEMPGMDGYELARKIRDKGQKAPIIFLTGNVKRDNVFKAIQVGASDFIIKPITQAQVLERISKFI